MARSGYRGRCFIIKNSELQQLPNDICESIECGDFIIKETGKQQHRYFVSYKEAYVGLCLTYIDASRIETVSYDFNAETKKWVYNSTDVWENA